MLSTEKRRNFRVFFAVPLQGEAKIISIDNTKVRVDKYFAVSILDLSAGGAKIRTLLDLPVEKNIILELSFELNNKSFALKGILLWKDQQCKQKKYGVGFIDLSQKEEQQLVYYLNKYQLNKIRAKKNKNSCIEPPAHKMLHAIPYPAILITLERRVLAVNELAQSLGVAPGAKCYNSYWNEDKICSFCRLEEALNYEGIVSSEIDIKDNKYLIYWLYLEKKIFLNYWEKIIPCSAAGQCR